MRHAAGIIISYKSDIVGLVKNGAKYPGLPFGKVEEGETIIDGAIRETFEETGINLSGVKEELIYLGYSELNRFRCHVFLLPEKDKSFYQWKFSKTKEGSPGFFRKEDFIKNPYFGSFNKKYLSFYVK